ncbi:dynein axonemal intermediate chain 4 [Plutella xylostella]|uniref:dynein axonemal intermediate chain 4 n=1 Tax=Plutella xylostella TaxID=51655 RepID=UPI0020327D1B|nr:dynein axonemal intermediate chain 4 [Plutella xylostella]
MRPSQISFKTVTHAPTQDDIKSEAKLASKPSLSGSRRFISKSSVGSVDTARGSQSSLALQGRPLGSRYEAARRVLLDGEDVTPAPLHAAAWPALPAGATHAAFARPPRPRRATAPPPVDSTTTDVGMKVYDTTIDLDDIHIDHTIDTEQGVAPPDDDPERAPSAYYLPKRGDMSTYPSHIFVTLKETDTVFLIDLPSYSSEKGTDEANAIEQENEFYNYITVGKGRNRKMVSAETQTRSCITQSRHSLALRPLKKNAGAFASLWDMHDTYAALEQLAAPAEPDDMVLRQEAPAHMLRPRAAAPAAPEHALAALADCPRFRDAALLAERVLASLHYAEEQKVFRGLRPIDPRSLDLVYEYNMRPLWTFESEETAGRPVAALAVNPRDPDIVAVGYGRYAYADAHDGLVCVWSTKSPRRPERVYRFEQPVTALAFSPARPQRLAAGLGAGAVLLLDVRSHTLRVEARSRRDTNPCFEPVWGVQFVREAAPGEAVVAVCQDGRINRFVSTKTHDLICTPIMRLAAVEGRAAGLRGEAGCRADVPAARGAAALCLLWHPAAAHVYFVGSHEGCVHRCSTLYGNQPLGVFRAHAGPVLALRASPFDPRLLATGGADGCVRLWLEGLAPCVATLRGDGAVHAVCFSPLQSTLLVAAHGARLLVWDLRRRTHAPVAGHAGGAVVTAAEAAGGALLAADAAGRVRALQLRDTPLPAYRQRRLLDLALRSALCTRPHLLRQLDKLPTVKD